MNRTFAASLLAATSLIGMSLPVLGADEGADTRVTSERLLEVPLSGLQIKGGAASQIDNPYKGGSNTIVEGETLFASMNCAGCHAPKGGGGMGPPLSDGAWIYGGKPADIYLSILQGRPNGMPAFANALPPQSIWSLVAYVQTLSQSR